jgi:hypothetical protein
MKFWKTTALFSTFLRGSSFLSGKWYQMMASRFVVDTTQLGQKCTTWTFSSLEGNEWNIKEEASLHYLFGMETERDWSVWASVENNKFLLKDHNPFTTDLWVKNKTDNTLMLMGLDNITFYILSRDPVEFESEREEIAGLLDMWDYDTYYKTPISTFDLECEEE